MALVKRSDKVAFLGVPDSAGDGVTYTRMTGFTEFSRSSNPKEYSRQYVDEDFEQTDVVGFSPSFSYAFDRYTESAVHKDLVSITDNELIGSGAVRSIVIVDLSDESTSASCPAILREFSVIPDAEGSEMEAYTYSGTFKVKGEKVFGTATTEDGWETCEFTSEQQETEG